MKKSSTLLAKEILISRKNNNLPVFDFGLGENPFQPPEKLIEIFKKYVNKKDYTNINMFSGIKSRILKKYTNKNYIPTEVILGNGLKELLFLAQLSFDGTIIHINPSWVSYKEQTKILNKKTTNFNTKYDDNYKIIPSEFDKFLSTIDDKKMIIFNNPCNPTGIQYSKEELEKLALVLNKHNCIIFADEIYLELSYDNNHHSISYFCPDLTIRGTSLSKKFSAGGWRCGWLTFPKNLQNFYNKMSIYASSLYSCISHPLYYVLDYSINCENEFEDYLNKSIEIFRKNTFSIYNLLISKTKLKIPKPEAAWYLFLDFSYYSDKLKNFNILNSDDLVYRLITDYGLISVSGSAFHNDPISIRLSCIDFNIKDCSNEKMVNGINKLINFLKCIK